MPLVRTELRPAERKNSGRADLVAAICLATAATALISIDRSALVLALLPRAIHLAARWLRALPRMRPGLVGLRETLSLATAIALSLIAMR